MNPIDRLKKAKDSFEETEDERLEFEHWILTHEVCDIEGIQGPSRDELKELYRRFREDHPNAISWVKYAKQKTESQLG